jgi:hypothetical protein
VFLLSQRVWLVCFAAVAAGPAASNLGLGSSRVSKAFQRDRDALCSDTVRRERCSGKRMPHSLTNRRA